MLPATVLTLASCAGSGGYGDEQESSALEEQMAQEEEMVLMAPPGTRYLECQTRPRETDIETIGPDGGQLQVNGHLLDIPAGAVEGEAVEFRMRDPGAANGKIIIVPSYEFVGNFQPSLTLSYAHCDAEGVESLEMHRWTLGMDRPSVIQGYPDAQDSTFTVDLDHTSTYIIASN
ncbi:MAG TPA: hypothetical protein VFI91_01715 [Longimicrobiaceae bacterium]|nr:hypothetical protein [Longimicrobiaceae bacterium]